MTHLGHGSERHRTTHHSGPAPRRGSTVVPVQLTATLPCPLQPTFEFFADPRNRPLWQRSLDRIEMASEGPPRVGMRWREWPPLLGEVTLEITELEPNRSWAERGVARWAQLDLRLVFTPGDDRTEIEVSAEVALPAWLGWARGLARRVLAGEIRRDIALAGTRIAQALRQRPDASGSR